MKKADDLIDAFKKFLERQKLNEKLVSLKNNKVANIAKIKEEAAAKLPELKAKLKAKTK